MAERLIAPVLKTGDGQPSVGSNPTLTAIHDFCGIMHTTNTPQGGDGFVNPAFAIIVILACVAIWFLASSLYKPIGKFIHRIGKDAIDEMTRDEKEQSE